MPTYVTAFDLIAHPERIQPSYGFDALFVVAAIVMTGIAVLVFAYRRRIAFLLFAIVWSLGVLFAIGSDITHASHVRRLVRAGDYSVVEGCLERFHPGSPGIEKGGDEWWSVGGEAFSYANGTVGARYHVTEAAGGAVHADARVRVTHMPGSEDILRLQVIPHACPPAPDRPL